MPANPTPDLSPRALAALLQTLVGYLDGCDCGTCADARATADALDALPTWEERRTAATLAYGVSLSDNQVWILNAAAHYDAIDAAIRAFASELAPQEPTP